MLIVKGWDSCVLSRNWGPRSELLPCCLLEILSFGAWKGYARESFFFSYYTVPQFNVLKVSLNAIVDDIIKLNVQT